MAIFRVNKTKDYTTMSNYHLKDIRISLKAKGLLSEMLSLPENWDYSVQGLVAINKENEIAIKGALNELKKYNYLIVKKIRNEKGLFEYAYDIYEQPIKPGIRFPGVDEPDLDNQVQLNTNNKELNNKRKKENIKEKKETYGTYQRVKLTIDEYMRLVNEYGEDFIKQQIEYLDEYIESNNNKNKYTNFNLVLRKSIRENWFKNKNDKSFIEMMKGVRDKYD